MKKHVLTYICILAAMLLGLLSGGCGESSVQESSPECLVVYSPHPQDFVQPLVREFERQSGITVRVVHDSTGELLSRVAQEKPRQADIFWGGAISKVAGQADLFDAYESVQEEKMAPQFRNRDGLMTRFTDVPAVLLVNTNLLGSREIRGYADLLAPWLRGRIAFANPEGSSSSYAHLVNMLQVMGKDGNYLEAFGRNLDGHLLTDSQAVCQGVSQGKYLVGCTYEEAALREVAKGQPVKIVYMQEGVLSVPDGIYIVKNTPHREAAQAFVEFLVSREVQQFIVEQLHRRSVRQDVAVPKGEMARIPLQAIPVEGEDQEKILARFRDCYEAGDR